MNDLPVPMSRVEQYLAVAAGMVGATLPEAPMSRLEDFLAVIAGDTSVVLPTPMSLCELWLAYVAGVTPSEPLELEGAFHIGAQKVDVRFFAVAAGMEGVEAPQPQNRTEEYWARIAEIKPIHGVLKYATGTNIALTDVVSGITSLENVYGDTFQQTYTGKNLLQNLQIGTSTTIGGNGISVTSNADGSITMTGTNLSTSRAWYVFNGTLVLPAGTYTYSGGVSSTVRIYNDSFGFIADSKTVTLSGSSTGNFSIVVEPGASVDTTIYPMIELGSTATPWEPYVGSTSSQITASPNPDYPQDIQVVTGEQTVTVSDGVNSQDYTVSLTSKNLFDYNGATASLNAQITKEPNLYTVKCVSGESAYSAIVIPNSDALLGKTCTIKSSDVQANTPGRSGRIRVHQTKSSNILGALGDTVLNITGTGIVSDTFTFPNAYTGTSDCFCIVLYSSDVYSGTAYGEQITYNNLQLEIGSTATAFEPYHAPIELAKIGTYQDYIYKSGDDWYVHKDIAKTVLNGSENWATRTNSGGQLQVDALTSISYIKPINSASQYCNYGVFKPSVYNWGSYRDFAILDNTRHFILGVNPGTTAESFKTQISANNIVVYCVLATATDTLITDPTLISQLDAINSAVLPKPNAYIEVTASGTNLAGALKISYMGEEE